MEITMRKKIGVLSTVAVACVLMLLLSGKSYVNNELVVTGRDGISYVCTDGRLNSWVRYDESGAMKKGEDFRYGGWYFFDYITGEMAKGR